jgi:hypothetical protein
MRTIVTLLALLGLLVLGSASLQAQVAAPTLNPTLDNYGVNPATVPWSYSRFGLAYARSSTETQVVTPPATTTTGSQIDLNLRAVGSTFAGYVNYVHASSGGTSTGNTELGLAAQLGGWVGLGFSVDSNVNTIGATFILGKTWYLGYENSDNGAGSSTDSFGFAYRSDTTHVEFASAGNGTTSVSTVTAETFLGSWLVGIVYSVPYTTGAFTNTAYRVSLGQVDPKGWSWALNYGNAETDDGAGSFTRSNTLQLGASKGF